MKDKLYLGDSSEESMHTFIDEVLKGKDVNTDKFGDGLILIDGNTFKAKAGLSYLLISNGELKIQIPYGSKNNTADALSKKVDNLLKHTTEHGDYVETHKRKHGAEEELSKYLGLPVVKRSVKGEQIFVIKHPKIKTLHVGMDHNIKKAVFENSSIMWGDGSIDKQLSINTINVTTQCDIVRGVQDTLDAYNNKQ